MKISDYFSVNELIGSSAAAFSSAGCYHKISMGFSFNCFKFILPSSHVWTLFWLYIHGTWNGMGIIMGHGLISAENFGQGHGIRTQSLTSFIFSQEERSEEPSHLHTFRFLWFPFILRRNHWILLLPFCFYRWSSLNHRIALSPQQISTGVVSIQRCSIQSIVSTERHGNFSQISNQVLQARTTGPQMSLAYLTSIQWNRCHHCKEHCFSLSFIFMVLFMVYFNMFLCIWLL